MVNLQRVRSTWTGWNGAPGVTTFYFPDTAAPDLAAVKAFWGAISNLIPNVITIQVENTGSTIDPTNGHLVGTWSGTAQTPTVGGATGGYSITTGPMIKWSTQQVHGRKMLAGRTFLIPIGLTNIATNGTIVAANAAIVQTAAQNLSAGGRIAVWGRPSQPGKGTLVGSYAPVTAATCGTFPAVLRSRRQ